MFAYSKSVLVAAFLAATVFVPAEAANRLTVTLDGGATITVDNISSFPTATIRTLVLAADRSTQDGCPYNTPDTRGLFRTGDRIVISNRYLAWLDLTKTDGVSYPSSFGAPYSRSGEMAGYWTLDPATQNFRYLTNTGPENCFNWARNELIPGSNSPSGQKYWWDKYGPPTEHVISFVTALDPVNEANDTKAVFTHTLSQAASNGNWQLAVDGQVNADGSIYYKTTGRMASLQFQVDITDNNDANGIAATMVSEVEYYFRATDILNAWRFSPTTTVSADNIFVFYWTAYSGQDEDATACDVATGEQWPSSTYTTGMNVTSNVPLVPTFATAGQPAFYQFPAGANVPMVTGSTCPTVPRNQDINTWKASTRHNGVVVDGTWMKIKETAPGVTPSGRTLTFNTLKPNPNGIGTKSSPYDVEFERMLAWNETRDGTFGFGVAAGPYNRRVDYSQFLSGKWYYALHALISAN